MSDSPAPAERTPADLTSAVRLVDGSRNERIVLAESALVGERAMGLFRFVLVAAMGASHLLAASLGQGSAAPTGPRLVAIVSYLLFTSGGLFAMLKSRPDPLRAFIAPFPISTIDFAFMTFMDHRDFVENGHIALGVSASARALMLCFSAVRFSTSHVAYNVVLAIASYIYVARLAGSGDVRALALVIATFVVIGLVIGWASRRTHTMFADVRRRDNLSRFLPRSVAERLIRQGEASLAPVQREVSVLFFDLRDFTTLSEKMSPREVLRFLDEYLGHMADVVKQHQGMVNKFLGDGMLALWGVPDHQPDHAARALAAALSMRARLAELNAQRAQLGLPAVRMGIGVHSGVVAAGMLGGADQHEYTVIGDAVNVASRVEGLTRRHEVDILATDRVLELAPNAVRARRIGEESVKGRSGTVVLHAILGPA